MEEQNNNNNTEEQEQTKEQIELEKLKEGFTKVVEKHNLKDPIKSQKIAEYLTQDRRNKISVEVFAKKFKMTTTEAKIFLAFILKGIDFKEKHLDKK